MKFRLADFITKQLSAGSITEAILDVQERFGAKPNGHSAGNINNISVIADPVVCQEALIE